jgi:FixJ family two-component response regulator
MSSEQSVIYVIDDDASVRDALRSLFRSIGHLTETFDSSEQFLLARRSDLPACLVLDVRLRGKSGLELAGELARHGIELPVIFITGHGDIPMSVMAMKAGAIEFLTKPFRDQDLLDAVHRGIERDRSRRAELAALAELRGRFASLTPRERQVMALVVAGRLTKQIAAALSLSEITVKVHRAQVMRKMQAGSLPDLVRFADRLADATPKG